MIQKETALAAQKLVNNASIQLIESKNSVKDNPESVDFVNFV
jgi:hypothetical protein